MNSIFFILSEVVMFVILLGTLSILIIPGLRRLAFPSFKETYLSDFLPFKSILADQKTVLCRDGKLCRVFEIKGSFLQTITDDERHFLFSRMKSFFDAMAERGTLFRFITKRERDYITDKGEFDIPLLQKIHEMWNAQFQMCFQTKNYLIIQAATEKEIQDLSNSVVENLSIFKPICLNGNFRFENETESPLLSFLGSLVNTNKTKIFGCQREVSEAISRSQVLFHLKEGLIELRDGTEKSFYSVLSIKKWGRNASPDILNDLLHLPLEFEILHHFKGFKKLDASTTLRYRLKQENLIVQNFFKNQEFETAIQNLEAGNNTLYDYYVCIFIKGQTPESALASLKDVRTRLLNHGIVPIQESDSIEWLWFSRFPSFDIQLRPRSLFSSNLASLIEFEENSQGISKCDWGEGPLRYFKTYRENAYALQVHVSERSEALAHSLTIAPSESGKTTLFQHLIGGALRHPHLRAYIFDRFNGTRIFTEAVGGSYIDLNTPGSFNINPLQCSDTPQNRTFLVQFLMNLAGSSDNTSLEIVSRAVDFIFKIPLSHRSLKSIFSYVFDTHSMVKKGLKKWAEGPYEGLLNGACDNLDFKSARLMAFEMTEIQKDPVISKVLTDYILHRIRSQVRETAAPHFIFIDETAPLLEDPLFAKHVQVLFREHRKLRGSINVCFQDAQGLFKSSGAESILNQCQTIFLFQNMHGKFEDYAPLNLTTSEWAFVKGTSTFSKHMTRGVLVKKGSESLVLNIDMGGLGKFLNLYKSGTEPLKLMGELKELWGDKWVEHFLISFFILVNCKSYGVMNVFDSSSYMVVSKILSSSYQMVNEAKHIGNNLSNLTTVLGKSESFNFSILAHTLSQNNFSLMGFSETRFSVPGFETKKEDFSALRNEFEKIFSGQFNPRGYMNLQMQEKTSQRRDGFFKNAVLTSLALVSSQKETIKSSIRELSSILKEANFSRDVRSDIAVTNRLLSLIVSEMIQERALFIQHLEMNSAEKIRSLPILLEKKSLENQSLSNLMEVQKEEIVL